MKNKIKTLIQEDIQIKKAVLEEQIENIEKFARIALSVFKAGNKLLIFGNGGSASDSLHIAAEFVGRFKKERRGLPAISLASNISSITALGNDYEFDYIFERQIEALGKKGDMAIGISTSGKSKNVLRGIKKAKELGLTTGTLTGLYKGMLTELADISINVPSNNTPRIQEAHITIVHIICEIIEDAL